MIAFLKSYFELMRFHRPVGIFLLGWPTVMALWLAAETVPSFDLIVIFISGIIVMRALGCVINDLTDRAFDGHVQRTQNRPLVSGHVTPKGALVLCGVLGIIAVFLVSLTTFETVLLSILGMLLTIIYPWMKRFMPLPQGVLGLAFAWAIPMAFMAQSGQLPLTCWLLFAATIMWTIAYDTLYAMADRKEDLAIGLKSSAIFLGKHDRLAVGLLQMSMLLLFVTIGRMEQLHWPFYVAILGGVLFTIIQDQRIKTRAPQACFQAFVNHQWLGAMLFFGILFS